jgi:hypothetical protein
MAKQPAESKPYSKLNIGTILTGGFVGFIGAAVLYRKRFPTWVPSIFEGNPVLFFTLFIVICAILGYVWALPEED